MSGKEHNTDDELMAAFIVGDAAAMEALYLRYRQSVYSWLLRMVGDAAEAEDIYQDVWLKVIRCASDYRSGNFRAWLWQIVRNKTTDRMRKKSPSLVLDAPVCADGEGEHTVVDQVRDDAAADALMQIEESERKSAVCDAIDALPAAQREVVLLRITGELSFKEIADMLAAPIGTVLARMHNAVKSLKAALAEKGVLK
ncbi:MAG: sigma-70 family RNA polymerase sigma factor [Kiritimatiellae bacterium]|nr:sigma-70 family RNA polymerase sigma factor [Kiritimatiellia bacterium]